MKTRFIIISLILTLGIIVFTCTKSDVKNFFGNNQNSEINFDEAETILKIHGSNTIGSKLMPEIIENFFISRKAELIHTVPGTTPEEKQVVALINKKPVSVEIHSYGSSTGFNDLYWKKCDIAMSSKPVPDEAVSKLKSIGNMRSSSCEHIIALDGIAIVVNSANTISKLSIPTIRKLFSGQINNWKHLGGPDLPVQIFRRDNNSGTHEVFEKLVMRKTPFPSQAAVCLDNIELSDRIRSNEGAIGYTSVTFTGQNKALKISGNQGTVFEPSQFSVQTEDYPLSRRLFLYTPQTSNNVWVRSIIEFALSSEGQTQVESSGFVAQTLRLIKPQIVNNDVPASYRKNVANALRLSVNFRFNPGGTELDNRSLRDIDRLIHFIQKEKLQQSDFMLFGFSDNLGDPRNNRILSYYRANAVAKMLTQKADITVNHLKGFGSLMPVSSNATVQGRMKNRRVEVWMHVPTGQI